MIKAVKSQGVGIDLRHHCSKVMRKEIEDSEAGIGMQNIRVRAESYVLWTCLLRLSSDTLILLSSRFMVPRTLRNIYTEICSVLTGEILLIFFYKETLNSGG
jgi:hypothetical protein